MIIHTYIYSLVIKVKPFSFIEKGQKKDYQKIRYTNLITFTQIRIDQKKKKKENGPLLTVLGQRSA